MVASNRSDLTHQSSLALRLVRLINTFDINIFLRIRCAGDGSTSIGMRRSRASHPWALVVTAMSIALPIPLIRMVGATAGEAAVVAVDGAEPTTSDTKY